MKNILGLDLGTNSIGWAKVSIDEEGKIQPQIKLGSRIIPMSQDVLGKFDSGVTESQTAARTGYRGTRRLRERSLQRRERLFRVLHTLNFLPPHFDDAIGWNKNNNKTYGKFLDTTEPKIAWDKTPDGKMSFIFMDSFKEMLADFKNRYPGIVNVPLDWTIFYLRNKALSKKISKEELAWIILNFNQKRGYYQLRGEEEEEDNTKLEEYYELKVVKVEDSGEKRGKDVWYNVILENGWVYRRSSSIPLFDWEGKVKEFIVTTQLEKDGSIKLDKDEKPRRSFRAPKEDDWKLQKKRTESSIATSGQTVGTYIYENLLSNPSDKVRGKLVRTIERKFYKQELLQILKKQAEFHKEFTDAACLDACVHELYSRNLAHQDLLRKKDLIYLLVEDLIFYQRPLKSKKSLISDCPYEWYEYVDQETGEIKKQHIKCIAKSNPYFQEMRLWQFIKYLRLYKSNGISDEEVTSEYLSTSEDYVSLYNFLNDKKEISQETLLTGFFGIPKPKKGASLPLRWNYVEDKVYPCSETRYEILNALNKAGVDISGLSNKGEGEQDVIYRMWHLLYSVDDRNELVCALNALAAKKHLPEAFVDAFKKVKPFKKEYGAYSEKATKKLLSLMRMGSLWSEDNIADSVKVNMQKLIAGDIDTKLQEKVGITFTEQSQFCGLNISQACYVVYGRFSEASDIQSWKTPDDLQSYINGFKQHSMRNPIVEQCVLETLRTVHDIWKQEGHIDEIHVELGRSMKSTAEQRQRMTNRVLANENTNIRIKLMLEELKSDKVEGVRPYSPMQQDILRIYEEGALQELSQTDEEYNDILKISKLATPSKAEITKYKLWLEQKYRSPYTGKTISLSKLFTAAYQIEHVIPQGRFFDDSLSNKVICEAEVNQDKSNMLGYEYIKKNGGKIINCPTLGDVKVFTEEEYKKFVAEHYSSNKPKAQKLMMDDIPEKFIERQMNDSRYISRVVKGLLSNIVREDGEEEATSKNVIVCSGGVTDKLKKDWGINDVWNKIVTPRFERMNKLTVSDNFGHWENKEGKRVFQTTMPIELQKGFSKKRIDHRHHAMDALVIALASRNIVNYLNNESAHDDKKREDLRKLLCDKNRIIRKPWESFTQDAFAALQDIVVSFKHYIRIINKASNYYEHFDASGAKKMVSQKSDAQWAVRKPLHKETVFGKVNLHRKKTISFLKALDQVYNIADKDLKKKIRAMMAEGMDKKKINAYFKANDYKFNDKSIANIEVFYYSNDAIPYVATRKPLDTSFDVKRIESISDTGIQKILLKYLEQKGGDPAIAFTPEGIADMNANITMYNDGKWHQPIQKVRVTEVQGEKFAIGTSGNNSKKYVEAQSGTNLFLAIYKDNENNRSYKTIPLNIVVERMKQGLSPVPERDEKGYNLMFYLSPNDLVYVPSEDEKLSPSIHLTKDRIYRMVSSTGSEVYFLPNTVATVLKNKVEFKSMNKMEQTTDGVVIKANCWKLEVDRLGNITKIIR